MGYDPTMPRAIETALLELMNDSNTGNYNKLYTTICKEIRVAYEKGFADGAKTIKL